MNNIKRMENLRDEGNNTEKSVLIKLIGAPVNYADINFIQGNKKLKLIKLLKSIKLMKSIKLLKLIK